MQNNAILFQLNGSLPSGRYLPGETTFPADVRLVSAVILCPQSVVFSLVMKLEVGGVLTGDEVTVNQGVHSGVVLLDVPVAAGAAVRWLCDYGGGADTSPLEVQISVAWESDAGPVKPAMSVRWVDGDTRFTLFAYDPATQGFTDVSNGLSAGRASLDTSNGLSFFLGGAEVFRVRDGVVRAPTINEWFWPPNPNPRLELVAGDTVLARLAAGGISFPVLAEVSALPALPGNNRTAYWSQFVFSDGTQNVAVASADGFQAIGLAEGFP